MKRLKFSDTQRALFYTWIGEKGVPNEDHFDTFRTSLKWEGEKLEHMESLWRHDCEAHTGKAARTDKDEKVRVQDKSILLQKLERTFDLSRPGGRLLWIAYCAFDNSLAKFDEVYHFDIEWYEKINSYKEANELFECGLVDFMTKRMRLIPALTLWVVNGIASDDPISKLTEEFRAAISPHSNSLALKESGNSL